MKNGFTLTELLITIAILVLVIGAVYSGYLLSRQAFQKGENAAEILQNGRVILERMTREIRQAREIVTELGLTIDEATSTIEFEDGHIGERYYYIRYFKEGSNVKKEIKRYYFSGDPGTYVAWNATPPEGQELLTTTTSIGTIGEYATDLKIWGPRVVNISIFLEKGDQKINLPAKIFGRNL